MIRYLTIVAALLSAVGCREQPPAAAPAGSAQPAAPSAKNARDLPQDSFRLAIDDVRSDGAAGKRIFVITVPSSTKRVTVSRGEAGNSSLPIPPSPNAERQCTFEVSRPVTEEKESNRRTVTVVIKLSTSNSASESPLTFPADDTTNLDDVVSFAAKSGLYKQDIPLVLGHLKFGLAKAEPLTLYVKTSDAEPTAK